MIFLGFYPEISLPFICVPFNEPHNILANHLPCENLSYERLSLYISFHADKIPFALYVHSPQDVVIGANVGATFLLTSPSNAHAFQQIIEHYMLDVKLLMISTQENILDAITWGIDGVVEKSLLNHLSL